jgi:hypothetical protein
MRLFALAACEATLFVLLGAGLLARSAEAAEFPFTGYIASDSVEVTAGPGRRYYVTDRLPRGTKVEVYREDDAGWLAIRPTDDCFSWIPAAGVEPLDDGVGRVREETAVWIGTRVEHVDQHHSQIALKAGELVQVLDQKSVASQEGQATWLKIAPPAGEFRYVHARDVSRQEVLAMGPPSEVAAEVTVEPSLEAAELEAEDSADVEPRRTRTISSPIALRDLDEMRGKLGALREGLAGLAEGTRGSRVHSEIELAQYESADGSSPRHSTSLSPDGFVPRKRREAGEPFSSPSAASIGSPGRSAASARSAFSGGTSFGSSSRLDSSRFASRSAGAATTARSTSALPVASSALPTGASGDDFRRQLEQLDLDLSLMVARDKATWNLVELKQRAQQLADQGPSPAERGEARLLLDKMAQFEQAFDVAEHGSLAGPLGNASPGALDPSSPAAPRYDAEGWLKPVISRSQQAAPYAVVDEDGKPLAFVTPSPGLNVGRYVNKQVGLYGRRGYIEALKTPHVVAERVIDLERHVR